MAKRKARSKDSVKAKGRAKAHPQPVDALVYPRFSGVPTFMRLPHIARARDLDVALIGVPFDGGATYRPGPRFGPRNVRVQSAMIRPWNPVLEINPFEKLRVGDFGDLSVNPLSLEDTFQRITAQLGKVLAAGARTLCVGGDHSILLPILRAIRGKFGPVGLVQFDAHNDTWSGYFGSPHSHGTPVRRAVEEGLLLDGCVLQVGLRGQVYSSGDFEFGREHGFQRDYLGGISPRRRRGGEKGAGENFAVCRFTSRWISTWLIRRSRRVRGRRKWAGFRARRRWNWCARLWGRKSWELMWWKFRRRTIPPKLLRC